MFETAVTGLSSLVALVPWFGAAALATVLLVDRLRRWAIARDLLDHPNHRSSHAVPTPRIGGVGLAVVWLGGLALLAWQTAPPRISSALLTICALGVALAAISLYDDVRSVAPQYRLLAHVAAALLVVGTLGTIDVVDAGVLGRWPLNWTLAAPLTVLWIVSLVNATNFIDGIDGMAGSQALVAGLGWMLLGTMGEATTLAVAGALLAGGAMGFLVHNWNPARIFMGDGGSALLGFLLATLPWILGGSGVWLVTACALWPMLLDTAWTLGYRLVRRMPVWESHRMHMYQQLVSAGQAPARVSSAYAAASCGGLLVAVSILRVPHVAPLVASVTMVGFVAWAMSARRWPRTAATTQRG